MTKIKAGFYTDYVNCYFIEVKKIGTLWYWESSNPVTGAVEESGISSSKLLAKTRATNSITWFTS